MTLSTHKTRKTSLTRALLLIAVAGLLAGCETTGTGTSMALAAKPADPPMTRSRAAMECWMRAEKDSAKNNLDQRADFVTKCIQIKMKTAQLMPRS